MSQKNQHDQKKREEKKHREEEREKNWEKQPRKIHPGWFVGLGVAFIVLIVLTWNFFFVLD